MTDLATVPPPPTTDPTPSAVDAPRRIAVGWLLALGVVTAAARWWFSHDRTVFHLAPDEPGQLAMARWLSGDQAWNMFDHSTWRPGFATLLAPIYWFTDEPATVFRGALVLNAVLGGLAAILLARLVLRLTDLAPVACVVTAAAVATTPMALAAGAVAWSEALVTLILLGVVWLLLGFYDEPTVARGLAAIACAVAGFTSHSRLLPTIAVTALATVGLMAVRRRWSAAGILAAGALVLTALSHLYADWIFHRVWDDPADNNTVSTVTRRLDDPIGILEETVGQLWYQLTATAAVFGLGTVVLIRSAFSGGGDGRPTARDARVVLALVLPLIGLSIVFMSGRSRPDHLIYGRYNDAVVWPVLVVGIAWLVTLRRDGLRRARLVEALVVAAALAASAYGIWAIHGRTLAEDSGVRHMVAGLVAMNNGEDAYRILPLTLIGATLFVVLIVLGRRPGPRSAALVVAAAAVLVVAGVRSHHGLSTNLNSWARAADVRAVEGDLLPEGVTVGYRFVPTRDSPTASWSDQRRRAQLYQFYLPGHRFVRDHGPDDEVGPYVFAPLRDPDLLAAGAELLWSESRVRIGLWREPDPDPVTALARRRP